MGQLFNAIFVQWMRYYGVVYLCFVFVIFNIDLIDRCVRKNYTTKPVCFLYVFCQTSDFIFEHLQNLPLALSSFLFLYNFAVHISYILHNAVHIRNVTLVVLCMKRGSLKFFIYFWEQIAILIIIYLGKCVFIFFFIIFCLYW